MRRIAFVLPVFASLAALAAPSLAVQSDLTVLIDLDDNPSTGCTVSGFLGVEQRVVTTVQTTTGPNAATVTRIEGFDCSNAQTFLDTTVHPVGIGNGSLGLNVVETYWPTTLSTVSPLNVIRLGVTNSNANGGFDELFTTNGTPSGPPIQFQFGFLAEIPTLSQWGLLALTLLLAGVAAWKLRRGPSKALFTVVLVLCAGGVAWALAADLDGTTTAEWPPSSRIAFDPAAVDDGDDIAALWALRDDPSARLYLRIDASLVFNTAPVADPQAVSTNEDTPLAITLTGSDADSDPLTFSIATPPANGSLSAISNPTATSADVTYTPNADFNGADSFAFQVDDGNGGTDTATVSITVNAVNDAPVVTPQTTSLPESSANGTNVGTPVAYTDPDAGQTHTYAITAGNTGGAFAIDPGTGQITVANSSALDFETNPTFSLTVQVTDDGTPVLSGTATITVNLSDANEVPVVDPATFTLAENSANGTNVGTPITFTDPDSGQNHTFALTAGNTGGAFAIDSSTGQITVATSSAVDFEANPTFSLTVQVTDDGTPVQSGTATVTVSLTDVNEAPVVDPATVSLPENTANGTNVGSPITFTDPDTGQTHTFAITAGNTGGAFAIGASSGQITVASSAALDFEANPTFSLTVQVTDDGTPVLSGSATITVNLTDVNEAPVVDPATFSLPENTANGTNVATPVTFTDPDAGQTHTFAITAGNTGGAFAIGASTGQITVASSTAVDFETNPTFSLTVQVTDNGTPVLSGTGTVTVNVTDVNEAPAVDPATFSLPENSANGTNVGTPVTFTDLDAGQTHTFAITAGNTDGAFAIGAASGQISVANSAAVDFETNPTFSLTVQVTDDGTPVLSGTATVTVNLTDVNEAPVVNPATFAVDESSANGTVVGTATFSDPDGGQTHTFAITAGNTGGAFAINPSTGQITVAAAIDFETLASYSLTVQVTDNGSPVLSGTATVTVNVNDVNEAPVVDPATFAVDESSANGTVVGTVTFSDPDGGQTHTYAITAGNTGGAFAIGASSGQITVAGAIDFETLSSYSLTVQVTDDGTPVLSGSATVTINVNDLNEAPAVNPATFGLAENTANGSNVGTPITFTDPDTGQTHAYAITAGNTGGAFAINAASGQITVANSAAVDFETNPTFSLTVQVTDNGTPVLSGTATVTVNLTDVNEAPAVNPATFSVPENSANGSALGTVTFSDADTGQTHTFAITAGNTGGAFTINSGSGAITVANSAALDFETTPSFSLTVQVTDNGTPNLSGTATITVNLTNVNEAPTAFNDGADINEEAPNVVALNTVSAVAPGVLGNDTDPDVLTTLTVSAVAGLPGNVGNPVAGTYGSLTLNANGSFTYTLDDANPAVNALNVGGSLADNFGYTASDGALTSSATLTVTIHGADDPATPDDDAWDFVGNTELEVDRDTASTPELVVTPGGPPELGVLEGDVDPDGGSAITISGIPACPADITAPFDCVIAGQGTVHLEADGSFSFIPEAGDVDPTATFQYTLVGNSNPATVTLTRFERVWFVDPAASPGGDGTSASPFDAIIAGNLADTSGDGDLTDDLDVAGDYLFVRSGTLAGSLELEDNEHLIGEGVALSIPVSLNGNPSPTVLVAAGTQPQMTNAAGNTILIKNQIPVEIRGMSLAGGTIAGGGSCGSPNFACNAIDLTTSAGALGGSSTLTIADNDFRGAGAEGIDVNRAATTAGTLTLVITNDTWNTAGSHVGNAIDVNNLGGADSLRLNISNDSLLSVATAINVASSGVANTTITGFADNTINGNTGQSGVLVANASFDAVAGGAVNQVNAGAWTIGASGNPVGGLGMLLGSVVGNLHFGDLDIYAGSGPALSVDGLAPSNVTFGVTDGMATLVSTGGPAVEASDAAITLRLASMSSTNSSNSTQTGVSLVRVTGDFEAPSGSTITSANLTDFEVQNSSVNVTYGGTITDDVGRLVSIASCTGTKTLALSGAITDGNDGDGSGISMTGNSAGTTVNFSGKLTLSTGANAAFAATGGGTVTATDTTSTIATTTGAAVNINGTTIGGTGVTFQSVAHNGNNTAISLTSTGAGPFTVTGGTIQNTVGADAVTLNSTSGLVTLENMIIQDITASSDSTDLEDAHSNVDAIHGQNVNGGLTLDNVTIQRISDNGINGTVNGAPPTATVWNGLTLTNCTFTNTNRFNTSHADANNESAVHILGIKGTVAVTGTSFSNAGSGLRLWSDSSGTLDVTIQSSSFTTLYKEIGTLSVGLYGIDIRQFGSLSSTVRIGDTAAESNAALGNTFTNGGDRASIDIVADTGSTGAMKTSIAKNTFTVTDHSSPGVAAGSTTYNFPQGGVLMRARGTGNFEAIFAANVLDQVMHADGGLGQLSMIIEKGDSEFIVRNNTFQLPWDAPIELRADGQDTGQNSAKVQFTGNTYVDGSVGDGTTDLGGPSPYTAFYTQVRNNGRLDLTIQNEASPFGLNDTSSGFPNSLHVQTTTAGDVLNLFLQNLQSPRGYQLKASAGTTYNLYRNGSVSGTAQAVLQDNGNQGGGGVDTTVPPVTNLSGAGTVSLSNTAPQLPVISPP